MFLDRFMKFKKIALFTISILIVLALIFLFTKPPQYIELEKSLKTSKISLNDQNTDAVLTAKIWQDPTVKPKGIILISHGFSSRAEAMMDYASALTKQADSRISYKKTENVPFNKLRANVFHIRFI